MQVCPGKRPNTCVYLHKDYAYNKDSRNNYIYRCSARRSNNCHGAVAIEDDGTVKVIRDHNHPASHLLMTQRQMTEEMIKLCRETMLPLKDIFDSVCAK